MSPHDTLLDLIPENLSALGEAFPLQEVRNRLDRLSRQECVLDFLSWHKEYAELTRKVRFTVCGMDEGFEVNLDTMEYEEELEEKEAALLEDAFAQLTGVFGAHSEMGLDETLRRVLTLMNRCQWNPQRLASSLIQVAEASMIGGGDWLKGYLADLEAARIEAATPGSLAASSRPRM